MKHCNVKAVVSTYGPLATIGKIILYVQNLGTVHCFDVGVGGNEREGEVPGRRSHRGGVMCSRA